jgi:predicted nucleic acid-binding protein
LVNTPPLSDECSDFLKRIEQHQVIGITSSAALAEAIHKVMLAEASARHGLERKGLAHYLQRHPNLLAGLHEHKQVPVLVRALNIQVETVTLGLLDAAADLSVQLGLLTNDATTIAVMESLGLSHLATNNDNFDRVPGITVWKPR